MAGRPGQTKIIGGKVDVTGHKEPGAHIGMNHYDIDNGPTSVPGASRASQALQNRPPGKEFLHDNH